MSMEKYVLRDETYQIIGICMEIHRILGHGFAEIVYKDALEIEVNARQIEICREKEYPVYYKNVSLKHKFFADFVMFGNIIVEIKASEKCITNDYIAQVINYLKVSGCAVALIINFGRRSLEYNRIVY